MMGVQEHKEHVVQPASANREFIRAYMVDTSLCKLELMGEVDGSLA